jgi:hypothetical protein
MATLARRPSRSAAAIFEAREFARISEQTCPIERAAAVTKIARRVSTLPPSLSQLRRDSLVEARAAGLKVAYIAERTGLTSGRISQLTVGTAKEAGDGAV